MVESQNELLFLLCSTESYFSTINPPTFVYNSKLSLFSPWFTQTSFLPMILVVLLFALMWGNLKTVKLLRYCPPKTTFNRPPRVIFASSLLLFPANWLLLSVTQFRLPTEPSLRGQSSEGVFIIHSCIYLHLQAPTEQSVHSFDFNDPPTISPSSQSSFACHFYIFATIRK